MHTLCTQLRNDEFGVGIVFSCTELAVKVSKVLNIFTKNVQYLIWILLFVVLVKKMNFIVSYLADKLNHAAEEDFFPFYICKVCLFGIITSKK